MNMATMEKSCVMAAVLLSDADFQVPFWIVRIVAVKYLKPAPRTTPPLTDVCKHAKGQHSCARPCKACKAKIDATGGLSCAPRGVRQICLHRRLCLARAIRSSRFY